MLFQGEKVSEVRNSGNKKIENSRTDMYKTQKIRHRIKKVCERIRSLKRRASLFSPMDRAVLPGKVSLCTSLKRIKEASLALETAMVLPLFFLGIVTMISFMDIYKIQTEHLMALCEKAKAAGMYAYDPDGGGVENITLPDVYSYKPIGGIMPLPKIWMYNTIKVHAWTGVAYEAVPGEEHVEKMVYVTESGNVYHRSLSCSYLNLSVTEIPGNAVKSRRNKYGEKYAACEICSRNEKPAGMVYITEKGNRYHNLESCSGLKRTVRLIKESEASELGVCSRCG